uniref:Late embryogenesis abundant protein LEA-2 subgroup domain-containing protein n=1 Tax=Hyaloperonospora arabidopsidis (strain Emoy2) TaxID=559515 RepID=M4B4T0_HYAAE
MSTTPGVSGDQVHSLVADYNDPENRKNDPSISVSTNNTHYNSLVKFLKLRVTRMQRLLLIGSFVLTFLIVILLLVYLVLIPAVIQHYINSAELSVNYLDVKSISSVSSLNVELSLNVQHDVNIAASTDDITASLLYDGVAFGSVVIPGLDIKPGEQNYNITVASSLILLDVNVFNIMAEDLMKEIEISLEATATVKAHAFGLIYSGLALKLPLALKGFNHFSHPTPEIKYINWFGCIEDVYQLDINVTLTNPSSMGLDGIGALNLSLYYADSYLGYAESLKPELGLPRGESVQLFRATMEQDVTALSSLALDIVGGRAQLFITGDNPHSTKYVQFQQAVSKINMSVVYTDGLSSLGFNPSCNILSLLGSAMTPYP